MTTLGPLLNTVERSTFPCPRCKCRERMEVHLDGVLWECGHTQGLPPIAPTRPKSRGQRWAQ